MAFSRNRALVLEIVADTKSATKGLSTFGKTMRNLGLGISAAFATRAVGRFIGDSITAANDLGESINAVGAVFGEQSDVIEAFGRTSAKSAGLSTQAFQEMAVKTGAILKNAGITEFGDDTVLLTQRAADLASLFNTDVSQAIGAIQSALVGQNKPLLQYGVTITAASTKAKAAALGFTEYTNAVKATAITAQILEQTADAAGDFADTLEDSLSNQLRVFTATWQDFQATAGQNALEPATRGVELATRALDAADEAGGNLKFTWSGLAAQANDLIGVVDFLATPFINFGEVAGELTRTDEALIIAGNELNRMLAEGVEETSAFATTLEFLVNNGEASADAIKRWADETGVSNRVLDESIDRVLEYGESIGRTEDDVRGLRQVSGDIELNVRLQNEFEGRQAQAAANTQLLTDALVAEQEALDALLPKIEAVNGANNKDELAVRRRTEGYVAADEAMAAIRARRFDLHLLEIRDAWNSEETAIWRANDALQEQLDLRNALSTAPDGTISGGDGGGGFTPLSVPQPQGGDTIVVNITGALDSVSAGREVRRVLQRYGAVTGG